jgi:hypothetical protein
LVAETKTLRRYFSRSQVLGFKLKPPEVVPPPVGGD